MRRTAYALACLAVLLACVQASIITRAKTTSSGDVAVATQGFPLATSDALPVAEAWPLLDEHFIETVKPKEDERRWRRIPWMTSLWKARMRGAEEGKPILLFTMDGNPLGST